MTGKWVSVKNRLPRMNRVVLVCYASGFDGKPIFNWGARIDGGDGWLWGVKVGVSGDICPDESVDWNLIDADDDYAVTHWQPLPRAPHFYRAKLATKPSRGPEPITPLNDGGADG